MMTSEAPKAPRLTARERELVNAITRGCTNREIASDFGISEQTVKNQLTSVFQKLQVRNRLQLALFALREGSEASG